MHCDVLGSGATELTEVQYEGLTRTGHHPTKNFLHRLMYDPSDHLGTIATRADRRIFALADRSDAIVPFKYQAQFIDEVKAAGHLAKLIEVDAKGPQHHGTELYALAVAGACLNEVRDEPIIAAVASGRSWGEQQHALGPACVADEEVEAVHRTGGCAQSDRQPRQVARAVVKPGDDAPRSASTARRWRCGEDRPLRQKEIMLAAAKYLGQANR